MSIVYIGMDVHKEQYTLSSYIFEKDRLDYEQKIEPDYKMVMKYIERLRER
jgi:hypothetical protein